MDNNTKPRIISEETAATLGAIMNLAIAVGIILLGGVIIHYYGGAVFDFGYLIPLAAVALGFIVTGGGRRPR